MNTDLIINFIWNSFFALVDLAEEYLPHILWLAFNLVGVLIILPRIVVFSLILVACRKSLDTLFSYYQ